MPIIGVVSGADNIVRARINVRGRVQMVGFRAFVVRMAWSIDGTVRNLADGSVECVAEGPRDRVEELIAVIGQGPPASRVTSVEVSWETPGGMYTGMRAT